MRGPRRREEEKAEERIKERRVEEKGRGDHRRKENVGERSMDR